MRTTDRWVHACVWQVEAQWTGFSEDTDEWTGFGAVHDTLEKAIEEIIHTHAGVLTPGNWRFRIVNRTTKEVIPWEIFA